MKFHNAGGPATNLTISASPACEVRIQPTDYLTPGAEGKIVARDMSTCPAILTVSYVDKDGESGRHRLAAYQPGAFRAAPPRPGTQFGLSRGATPSVYRGPAPKVC
jgi:hypothetical protein